MTREDLISHLLMLASKDQEYAQYALKRYALTVPWFLLPTWAELKQQLETTK